METNGTSETKENKINPQQRLADKEKLVRELTDMGFSKSLVQQVTDFNTWQKLKLLKIHIILKYVLDCRQCR